MSLPAERNPSIYRRLLWWLLIPVTTMQFAGLAFDYITGVKLADDGYDKSLAAAALTIAAQIRSGTTGQASPQLLSEALQILRSDPNDLIYFRVRELSGRELGGDSALPIDDIDTRNPRYRDISFRGATARLISYRSMAAPHTAAGPVVIAVAETTSRRNRIAGELLATLLTIDLLQLGTILVLVWIGVRLGLGPLQNLRDQIAARSARDLSSLEPRSVPTELRGIVQAFNRLFAAVREAGETQQHFLANAAHQLRTPVAGLQAQLELLAADPKVQPVRDRLLTLHAAILRLGRTANQLLALARADPSVNLHRNFQATELAALIEPVIAEHLDRAVAGQIELAVETQNAFTLGIPWLLQQLLANLLDNAIIYTSPGGFVTVRCGLDKELAFLEVEDTGSGISLQDRARVTQRFVRGDGARGEGSGLGLAIVGEIAQLHGATLRIREGAQGRGTCMRVEFPPFDSSR